MTDRYADNWWTDLRWRVGNQFMLLGLKMMPRGDCKEFLLDRIAEWVVESKRQYWLRTQSPTKEQEKDER